MARCSPVLAMLGLAASALLLPGCAFGQIAPTVPPTPKAGAVCRDQATGAQMSLDRAKAVARSSACVAEGTLKETRLCNENTGTWWIDLNLDKEGCSPACVVDVNTGDAEINWRCTGLAPAEDLQGTAAVGMPERWATYTNSAYRVEFQYPLDWLIEEEASDFVRLRQGMVILDAWFMPAMESREIATTGVPAGEFEERGIVTLMGEAVPRNVLVNAGRDKGVFYGGPGSVQRDELLLVVYLLVEDDPGAAYDALELASETQSQADLIVESFGRLPVD